MEWCILDAIGPFFRGLERTRINWSKIPFEHLAVSGPEARAQWDRIAADLTCLVTRARQAGFNAVTLDDVAHLAPHPYHGPGLNRDLTVYRAEFGRLFRIVSDLEMAVFLSALIRSKCLNGETPAFLLPGRQKGAILKEHLSHM